MNIWTWNFRGFCFTANLNRNKAAALTFATKEAKSNIPRLTCGSAVIKLLEAATEAFTATTGFLTQFSETLFSPSNPTLLWHLTVVAEKEDEEEEEEERLRPNGLDVCNNLVVAIVLWWCTILLVFNVFGWSGGLGDLYHAL